MKRALLKFYVICLFLTGSCSVSGVSRPGEPAVVSWGSPQGVRRLEESRSKIDFFALANHFESQSNKVFCGPASAAIVLNSLRVRNSKLPIPKDTTLLSDSDLKYLPTEKWTPFFERYTQNSVFLRSPKSRARVLGKPSPVEKGKGADKKKADDKRYGVPGSSARRIAEKARLECEDANSKPAPGL